MLRLVYLDPYHHDDVLYLDQLGKTIQSATARTPLLFVHASGEEGARLLEAEAVVPRREGGRLIVQSAQHAALVERAVRHANQRIVGRLTEAGVSAVGIQGVDRGVLRAEADGALAVRAGWIRTLAERGAVPVVSALVAGTEGIVEAEPAVMVAALATALEATVVVLAKPNRPGLIQADAVRPEAPVHELTAAHYGDLDVLSGLVRQGVQPVLTNAGAAVEAVLHGTRIV